MALGAVACAVAGVLLLGGQGSLAYWTTRATAPGGSVTSGSLSLGAVTCQPWQLIQTGGVIGGTPTPNPTTYTTQPLQPGDVLTMTCTSTLTIRADHLKGTIVLSGESLSSPAGPLVLDGTPGQTSGAAGTTTYPVITITPAGGAAQARSSFTAADNGATVTAKVAISIPTTDTSNPTADASQTWTSKLNLVAVQGQS